MSIKSYTLIVLLLLLGTRSYGQSFSILNGSVLDPSGRAAAGAEVVLIGSDTGSKRTTVADSNGLYAFTQVVPGKYQVIAKAPGFSVKTVNDLQLLVNTPATLNISLEVGAVTQTVNVEAGAAQVNTTDASLGDVVGTRAILQLPLEARNPAILLTLLPSLCVFVSYVQRRTV
jgi:hypothetical protein